MKIENPLETFFQQRNTAKGTQKGYKVYIKHYEEFCKKTLQELLQIAEKEETDNIRWKNTYTREILIQYREYLYNNYTRNTAGIYFSSILTVYRHFEIEIGKLPYFSKKQSRQYAPIIYDDLPDREILTAAINIATPRARALILFMSSSGLSRIDTTNLTIKDYLDACYEYTATYDLNTALQKMKGQDIIPTFNLQRQKTGQAYFTFCSHEAVKAINIYLENRTDDINLDTKLFNVHERYISKIFDTLNNQLGLGKVGAFNRLRPHMLRKYHATKLAEAGMSTEKINLLQGRKIEGVAYASYIRIRTDNLKEEYVKALPYLVVEDINKVKTQLEQTEEELESVTKEKNIMEDNLKDILYRIRKLEEKETKNI